MLVNLDKVIDDWPFLMLRGIPRWFGTFSLTSRTRAEMTNARGFLELLPSQDFVALAIQAGVLSIIFLSAPGLQVGLIGGAVTAGFLGKACVNDGF